MAAPTRRGMAEHFGIRIVSAEKDKVVGETRCRRAPPQRARHRAWRRADGLCRRSRRVRRPGSTSSRNCARRRSSRKPISSAPRRPAASPALSVPLHVGRRTIVWQTSIYGPDGKLVAMVTQTQLVLSARLRGSRSRRPGPAAPRLSRRSRRRAAARAGAAPRVTPKGGRRGSSSVVRRCGDGRSPTRPSTRIYHYGERVRVLRRGRRIRLVPVRRGLLCRLCRAPATWRLARRRQRPISSPSSAPTPTQSPDLRAAPIDFLPRHSPVAVAETGLVTRGTEYVRLDTGGYLPRICLSPTPPRSPDLVAAAALYLGCPYLWGGRSFLGLDCSGLVQQAFRDLGIAVPRDTDMQRDAIGEPVAVCRHRRSAPRRPDLHPRPRDDLCRRRRGHPRRWRQHDGAARQSRRS